MAKPSPIFSIVQVLPKGKSVTFGLVGDSDLEPVSAGSSGGWQIVDRPRQKAITQWYDASPMQLTLTLLLDGGVNRDSVEPQCATVFGWQYPPAGQLQPAVLALKGPVSQQALGLYWVLYTVKFDEDKVIRDPDSGARTQVPIAMTLYEFVPATATVLTNLTPAQAAQRALTASNSTTGRRTYVVRQGDTLSKIAARELGSYKDWTEIAKLNSIRDPSSATEVKPGRVLVLST